MDYICEVYLAKCDQFHPRPYLAQISNYEKVLTLWQDGLVLELQLRRSILATLFSASVLMQLCDLTHITDLHYRNIPEFKTTVILVYYSFIPMQVPTKERGNEACVVAMSPSMAHLAQNGWLHV